MGAFWSTEEWEAVKGEVEAAKLEKYKSPRESHSGGGMNGEDSGDDGCFIATVCFGEGSLEVRFLRRYRDIVLMSSKAGRIFVWLYYYIGPHIANIVRGQKSLLAITRSFLRRFIISRRILPLFKAGDECDTFCER